VPCRPQTHRRRRRIAGRTLLGALALLALAGPAAALAAAPEPSQPAAPARAATPVTDRIIVEWKAGATSTERAGGRADADTSLVRTLGRPAFQLVQPQAGQSVRAALAALRADPDVRVAERDGFSVLHATTNDPLFDRLWGLQNNGLGIDGFAGAVAGADADVPAAWDRTRGTPSTVIADLDTGYRLDAPDLAPVVWTNPGEIAGNGIDDDGDGIRDDTHGADFVGSEADAPRTDGDPTDDDVIDGGHGVHTAGTMGAAGNNGVGISGVAQDVRIMPLRVCTHATSRGEVRCPTSSQILAINYAGAHGARAANMSLGGLGSSQLENDALAANANVLFVISAGNGDVDGIGDDNDVMPTYPCSYPLDNIVCVAATDQADELAGFSNYGATSVDLGAPGTEILSTYPDESVRSTPIDEDFETNTFATTWSTTGPSGFARAAAGDGPLTSFGMTDSPGGAPAASSIHDETLTTGVAVPANAGGCTLSGMRRIARGSGGSFFYEVQSDGAPTSAFFNSTASNTSGSGMAPFSTIRIGGLGGHRVKLHFGFGAGASPTSADGLWLDDLQLTCDASLALPPTYDFLDGTSMAAPHVTGAAGLLFSLEPGATVAQVKAALLSSVDPDPALAGITVSGGRLDVARALDALVPPGQRQPGPPAGGGGGGAVIAIAHCRVPRLKGLSLARARRALAAAHCALGRVTKPRHRRGRRAPALVVKSSTPAVGTVLDGGARVALKLRAKPRARRRAGRRAHRHR
jgi:hypothetical protein